jgi:hypothetical protein
VFQLAGTINIIMFIHQAQAPWPVVLENDQLDWVTAVEVLEAWLNRYIGPLDSEWAYTSGTSYYYWQACVEFRQAKHKTLFLLQWT